MATRRLCYPLALRCIPELRPPRAHSWRPFSFTATAATPTTQHRPGVEGSSGSSRFDKRYSLGLPYRLQIRSFALDAKRNGLTNELLVATVMKKFPNAASSDDVQVRMILEKQGKSSSDVVPLTVAIQTAVEEDRDLVAVALDQEVPVIKVVALSALEYKARKKKPASSSLPEKEVQLKTGTEEGDLMRKVEQMVGYLQKGHRVKLRVRGKRRQLIKNPEAVVDTMQEVIRLIQENEAGEPFRPPETNPQKSQGHVLLHAPTKKK